MIKAFLTVVSVVGALGFAAQAAVIQDAPPPDILRASLDVGHVAPIQYLAFRDDESISVGRDGQVRWHEVQSGALRAQMWLTATATEFLAAPDGSLLASENGVINWWSKPGTTADEPLVLRRAFVSTRDKLSGLSATVAQILLSHDGKTLAALVRQMDFSGAANSAHFTDAIRLWNSEDGRPRGEIALGATTYPLFAAFSADDKTLLVADKTVTVHGYDVVSGAQTQELHPPESARYEAEDLPPTLRDSPRFEKQPFGSVVQISPDGRLVLTQTLGSLKVWNCAAGTVTPLEKSQSLIARFAEFSSDGASIAVVGSNCACLWAISGELRGGFAVRSDDCLSLALSSDGNGLAVGDKRANIALWDVHSAPQIARLTIPGFTQTWRF